MLANIMQGLDTTIANVALPHIRGSLSASLDQISWVLTFYINLPVGVIAGLGALIFMRETRHAHREPFDFLGFATFSLAIGALQMLLDRGELKDWFGSIEIWVEATISGVALYLFIVHTAT